MLGLARSSLRPRAMTMIKTLAPIARASLACSRPLSVSATQRSQQSLHNENKDKGRKDSPKTWSPTVLGAGALALAVAAAALAVFAESTLLEPAADAPTIVDTSTGAILPATMVLPVGPAKTPTRFVAVGHGPRQVTFLSINVYTIALYIPDTPAARAALAAACSDSAASLDRLATDPATRDLVLYLTPARATTAAHLRDGFVRTFMDAVSRATGAAAVKAGTIAAADAVATRDRMLSDIDRFKTEFPPSAVDKGHVYLFRRPAGSEGLEISLHGKTVGTIQSEWMAAALSTAYLRADKPLSPKLRESIVQFPSPAAIKEGM